MQCAFNENWKHQRREICVIICLFHGLFFNVNQISSQYHKIRERKVRKTKFLQRAIHVTEKKVIQSRLNQLRGRSMTGKSVLQFLFPSDACVNRKSSQFTMNFNVLWNLTEIAIFWRIFCTFLFISLKLFMLEARKNCHLKEHFISFTMVCIMWALTKSKFWSLKFIRQDL